MDILHWNKHKITSVQCIAAATASTMGNIMATVAVLEIHMERKAVVDMNPSMIIFGEVPYRSIIATFFITTDPKSLTVLLSL